MRGHLLVVRELHGKASSALRDGGAEVLPDGSAEDLVLPDESLASLGGSDFDDADPVLAVTAGLLDVPTFGPAVAGNGLAISDARHLRGRLDAVLSPELFEDDGQGEVPQAGQSERLGLLR